MSEILKAKRKRALIWLGGAAVALVGVSALTGLTGGSDTPRTDRMGKPVLPGFAAKRADASEIRVTLADETYTLVRTSEGFTMKEAGGYGVRTDRLGALANGLETMTWGEGRTRDADKFDLVGLGDPREGGKGALVTFMDSEGEVSAELITGRKGEYVYARAPGGKRAFRVDGDLPPLYSKDAWLDLDIIDLNPDAVSAVRLEDDAGMSIYLKRRVGGEARDFIPGAPFQDWRLRSRLAASTPALALTRLQPVNVKPASALKTQPVARHITETYDGLEVDLQAYREADGFYVTLRAIEAGEGARRGSTINDKAEGWAFELSEFDWAEFTPRIETIVRAPS